MSLFGFSASKNPPTLSGNESANLSTATIKDLTITDHLYFQPATSSDSGNLAFNMSVNPTTDTLTINTPQLSSINFALGTDATHQETLFAINPSSLNFNVSNDLKTLTYNELWTLDGATSNIQTQIDAINTAFGSGSGIWGSFYCDTTLTNIQNGGATYEQNACLSGSDPNTNGFYLTDTNATYGSLYNSIVIENAGVYQISYQARPGHTSTANEPNRIWLRLNGNDISESALINNIPAGTSSFPTAFQPLNLNWVMYLDAGDKIQPMWSSPSSNVYLAYSASFSSPSTTGFYSVLVNIQQIVNVSTGPQGPQGPAGSAATIHAGSVTTLAAGSSATVVNSGTTSAAIFNFGIPQGVQGIQGPKGDTGPQGPAGSSPDMSNYPTNASMGLAISTACAATLTAANSYTDTAVGALAVTVASNTSAIATNAADIATLQAKTENQTAVPSSTTFAGAVNCDTLDTDNIILTTQMSGIGKLNLSSTTGSNLIQAPSTTLNSSAGAGAVYLGGYTDTVYINNFPFSFYFAQQW